MLVLPPALLVTPKRLPMNAAGVIALLNDRLAEAAHLAIRAKQAHWNAGSPRFTLFAEIRDAADGYTEVIAKRVVHLGGVADGTVRVVDDVPAIAPVAAAIVGIPPHVSTVARALTVFGRRIRLGRDKLDELGDRDSSVICAGIARGIDKWLWFIDAHARPPRGRATVPPVSTVAREQWPFPFRRAIKHASSHSVAVARGLSPG